MRHLTYAKHQTLRCWHYQGISTLRLSYPSLPHVRCPGIPRGKERKLPVSLLDLLPSFSSSNHLLDCVSTGIRSPISCSTYILHITVQHSGIKSVSLYPVSLFIYFLHANKTTQKIFAKYIRVTFLSALKKYIVFIL